MLYNSSGQYRYLLISNCQGHKRFMGVSKSIGVYNINVDRIDIRLASMIKLNEQWR